LAKIATRLQPGGDVKTLVRRNELQSSKINLIYQVVQSREQEPSLEEHGEGLDTVNAMKIRAYLYLGSFATETKSLS
jgi:hypothetical protein